LPRAASDANAQSSVRGSYAQGVRTVLAAFITWYMDVHDGQLVKASEVTVEQRRDKGQTSVRLWLDLQRGMIRLMGTRRVRSYAHHTLYTLCPIFTTFGKGWAVTTEGSEALHTEMKFFHARLVHHGPHGKNDMFQNLYLHTVNRQLAEETGFRLPASVYAAIAINATRIITVKRYKGKGKKRTEISQTITVKGERASKVYGKDAKKMGAVSRGIVK